MAAASESSQETPEVVNRMLSHIASSEAIVKSQQRDEEDISVEDKCKLLQEMWHHNPVTFLERFHRWLHEDDLECFKHLADQYEVKFFLKEVKKRLDSAKSAVSVRNRRYEALKKLEKEGKFFSDDEMKARDPLMFEQLIGQFQSDEDRKKKIDMADLKFSSILSTFIDEQEVKEKYGKQKELEDDMMEEEDEDEDEEEEEEEEEEESDEEDEPRTTSKKKRNVQYDRHGYPIFLNWEPTPATEAEKAMLRQEFLTHMHQRFLSGQEKDFDYSSVDYNTEYDSLDIRTQDEEEKYFDEDSAEDASPLDDGGEGKGGENGDNEELEEWETFGNDVEEKEKCDDSEVPMER